MPLLTSTAPRPCQALLVLLTIGFSGNSMAAIGGGETEFNMWWNLIIALVVLVFSLASAALPAAAIRQWRGAWCFAAAAPLVGLLLWLLLIVVGRLIDPASHRLWPFEIFAWAMLNMIYMVAVMTTKRTFEKADQEKANQENASAGD
ncbi:MAG: hypothetical protein ACE37N_01820 [Pseudohongiellaceae bacterium]|jgi:phosphoglycerol transferase MdoB-like AlkP superfamily enzyme